MDGKSSKDKSLSQRVWRTRQIGIFFAKKDGFWTFVILLAPLSASYNYELYIEEDFRFCVGQSSRNPNGWVAEDKPVQDLIESVSRGFEKNGHEFLTDVLLDVLWGTLGLSV